jgi:hypothetical protein
MKTAVALCASLLLAATPSLADSMQGPLPPGKPAGTHAAQGIDNTTLYIIAGLAVLGIIIGVAASGGNDNSASSTAVVTPH